ncbi:MAG: hypothetical protein H0W66_00080 [Chthoniobacterales bacterium]|nr:hypothetical protein [Chthoniobacterales bacterium]
MKNSLCFFVCCGALLFVSGLRAGTEELENKTAVATSQKAVEETPLDIFKLEQGYVFQSDLNHGGSFGQQDEIQSELEYGHRFLINGNFYAHVGFAYDRYDFGSTGAPVPNHLQAMAGVFGIDYMHGKDVGAFFQVRPGFYFQNDIGISSFDAPITLGRIFVVQEDKFYIFVGAYASFLRSGFPVLPLAGVVYIPSDKLRIMAVLPEPKIIYSATKRLNLWAGGELVGGSFRTDRNDNIRPGKLNGTQVDFSDYRAGLGLTYGVSDNVSFDLGAGISFQRQFDFGRAGETYRTDPSPYVRMQMSASF